ncbi:flagellar hook assembly protein FlgD [Methyloraptor flagellatus]|jgi:flagellar basal-body rod modification protein FlgD|uniref:Basal-body rod modification protein FlgD n=1 Tax=Methyloraptor flagellatus TaxID=3162530 RepID=A0AAU7XA49_9HYPH
MSISALTTPTVANSTNKSDSKSLSSNYQMFLQLLVTQLQNQSPLNPMDSSQFTTQLVQYSSVEQQIKSNATLTDLKTQLTANTATNLVSYLGSTVSGDGSTATATSGGATWSVNASDASPSATVTVKDSSGNTVYTSTKSMTKGTNAVTWDGTRSDGATVNAGDKYTISVSGSNSAGSNVTFSTDFSGTVTKVDFSGAEPILYIGDTSVSLWNITSVQKASSTASTSSN